MYKNILFIGTGQIGKAILNEIVKTSPRKIIIHNLTEKESVDVCEEYSQRYSDIEFVASYGNVFMPYLIKDVDNKRLYEKTDEIIDYFYGEITTASIEKSTIAVLVKEYSPDLIIDAINTATVLGNAYNPEYNFLCYQNNAKDCCKKLMVDDYTTKIVNFVYCLKYCLENHEVKKYVKVSTTGLGGMGINMPYTHGDNPKYQLSSALMGKMAASGVLHQLLWNLSHENNIDVSLVIPGCFVGYDSVMSEPIETEKGLLKKRRNITPISINDCKVLEYNKNIASDEYLEFPVVRAGENHVYSKCELEVLTAIGQMEAITKEEVAMRVMECLYSGSIHDVLKALDGAMLQPTYSGRKMIEKLRNKLEEYNITNGIATGNLGGTLSKYLYELYYLKLNFPTIDEIKANNLDKIADKINAYHDEALIEEIVTLGLPILKNDNSLYISDYTLIPGERDNKDINADNIDYWCKIGWVDLRSKNIDQWCKMLVEIYDEVEANSLSKIELDEEAINNDYNIAEYLAYYFNKLNTGRKK